VCHHHAPSMLPFCVTGVKMKPLNHLGATMGTHVPVWDSRHEFGNTNMLVARPEEGASLARALGPYWTVLMRRHGATVAGRSLEELTFRTIYTARNAAAQIQAELLGAGLEPLNAEETELGGNHNLMPGPVMRAWEYWSVRLDKAEGNWPPKLPKRAVAAGRKAPAKNAPAKKKQSKRRR
jgi:ribulose-5-phosphate 4-epimerase/fuculose-1-phosphate aldolase